MSIRVHGFLGCRGIVKMAEIVDVYVDESVDVYTINQISAISLWGGSLTHPHVTHEFVQTVTLIIETGHL